MLLPMSSKSLRVRRHESAEYESLAIDYPNIMFCLVKSVTGEEHKHFFCRMQMGMGVFDAQEGTD